MRQEKKSKSAGVYLIFCLPSGLAYVGASRRLTERLRQHFDLLRLNRHHCKRLQQDWNELGGEFFITIPVEKIGDVSSLAARERACTRKCLIEGKVYNQLNAITDRHKKDFLKHKAKWTDEPVGGSAKTYTFVSPTGTAMEVKGLRGICEAYSLNPSHMSKVARGLYVQHRGWTAKLENAI